MKHLPIVGMFINVNKHPKKESNFFLFFFYHISMLGFVTYILSNFLIYNL